MDRMEHEELKEGDESIEDWLDRLEAKMDAMEFRAESRKIKWCKAKIGNAGLQVLKGLEPIRDWEQAKAELIRYFGDELQGVTRIEVSQRLSSPSEETP